MQSEISETATVMPLKRTILPTAAVVAAREASMAPRLSSSSRKRVTRKRL